MDFGKQFIARLPGLEKIWISVMQAIKCLNGFEKSLKWIWIVELQWIVTS